jgi:hypothetical protein
MPVEIIIEDVSFLLGLKHADREALVVRKDDHQGTAPLDRPCGLSGKLKSMARQKFNIFWMNSFLFSDLVAGGYSFPLYCFEFLYGIFLAIVGDQSDVSFSHDLFVCKKHEVVFIYFSRLRQTELV